jgi:transposase-like protein
MAGSRSSLAWVVGRSRWSEADARTVLDALAASGSSVSSFAARYGIQAQRINMWRRNLAAKRETAATEFVEVDPRGIGAVRDATRYELLLADGDALRVEGVVDIDTVRALIELLRASRPC